jgi:hypothetical protein
LDLCIKEDFLDLAGEKVTFNFVPNERIKQLCLSPHLKFPENIRSEHNAVFETMMSWSWQNTTGIVVTGQPGTVAFIQLGIYPVADETVAAERQKRVLFSMPYCFA